MMTEGWLKVFSLLNNSIALICLGSIGLILMTPSLVFAGQLKSDKKEEKEGISVKTEVLSQIIDHDLTTWPITLSLSPYQPSLSQQSVVSSLNYNVSEELGKSWQKQSQITSYSSLLDFTTNNIDSPSATDSPLEIPEPSSRLGVILIVLWLFRAFFSK